MNKIDIKIAAPAGGGKTTMLYIIAQALKEYGFTVDVVDADDGCDIELTDELIAKRVKAMIDFSSVQISTVQAQRLIGIHQIQSMGRGVRSR